MKRLWPRLPAVRRRTSAQVEGGQTLETRILPSGNVSVRVSGQALVIDGDSGDNEVSLVVDGGMLVVRGLNATTINGLDEDFIVSDDGATFVGRVLVRLGRGDDTFAVGDGVVIHGQLKIHDFFGNDRIAIDAAQINGGLQINTFYGNDRIRLNGTKISGETSIKTGFGDDLVVLDNVTTTAFFRVSMGPGEDGLVTDGNTFGNKFVTRLGRGEDSASFDSDAVQGSWIVRTGRGDDAVRATNMLINGSTLLRSTVGNDNFQFVGTNQLTGRLIARLGAGEDNLEFSEDTETFGGVSARGVEGDVADEPIYASRFDAATFGLIARADTLRASIDGPLTLVLDEIEGTTLSNGVLLTRNQQFIITGKTHANAVVSLDVDNDGFDDGTVIANNDGEFSLSVTLLSNAVSAGIQTVRVRSTFAGTTVNQERRIDLVEGTVVQFATTLGNYDVELFNTAAPATVANFLNYLARYADSIIHRSEKTAGDLPFVIQGGGFVNPPDVVPIAVDAPVVNEFNAANSNIRGTLAMALPSNNIDGGTSQWFVNTGNNASLDSGKYTVFGKVLGDGMTVVDSIHALTSYNLIGPTGETALANVPLRNYTPYTEMLAGTASVTAGSATVTGVGTNFLTDLRIGEAVKIGELVGVVAAITDDATFTLAIASGITVSGETVRKNGLPAEASYVTLSSVATRTI